MVVMFCCKEVKTWLASGARSLPLSPECTADVSVSMLEHVLYAKSSFIAGVLLNTLNEASLPDFLLNRGMCAQSMLTLLVYRRVCCTSLFLFFFRVLPLW